MLTQEETERALSELARAAEVPPPRYQGEGGKWYVASVRSNCEDRAVRDLRAVGFDAFNPTYSKRVGRANLRRTLTRALMPGYCYVQLDIASPNAIRAAYNVKDVSGLLGSGFTPGVVPDAVVAVWRAFDETPIERLPGYVDPVPTFRAGDTVSTVDGPLAGMILPVLAVDKSGNPAVEFTMFGKTHAKVVRRHLVRLVASGGTAQQVGIGLAA